MAHESDEQTSALQTAGYFVIGLFGVLLAFLMRPSIILGLRSFLLGSARDGQRIMLSSPKHRHRVQFETVEGHTSTDQTEAVKDEIYALAQAEDWPALGQRLEDWDSKHAASVSRNRFIHPALHAAAEALSQDRPGPRHCEALDVARITDAQVDAAIAAFRSDPNQYGLAGLIVHLIASQCSDLRGASWASDVEDTAWDRITEKCETAQAILSEADVDTRGSALLCIERMGLLYFMHDANSHIYEWFEAAVKADPGDSAPHMMMGCMMLPRWFGDYEAIESTALQAAAWTQAEMGNAAYALIYNSVFEQESIPLFFMDKELYSEAVHDLVKYRDCSPVHLPEISQLIYAVSHHSYPSGMTNHEDREEWNQTCHSLYLLSLQILEDYLPAIHPDSWIDGTRGALGMVSRAMAQELADGLSLVVGPRGISAHAPEPDQEPLPAE